MPDRPALVAVPNVELIEVGTWATSTGIFTWDIADLESAIDAQNDPAVRTPVLKLGHTDPRFDGEPSIGRIENLRMSADRMTLLGDLTGVPAWLADVMGSAFPSRSIEGEFGFESQTGTRHRFVLTALALLGVQSPAISTLSDIAALYGVDPQTVAASAQTSLDEEQRMPKPVTVEAAVSLDQVRQAFYAAEAAAAKFGVWAWIREVYTDHVIVDDDEGHLFKLPWSEANDAPVFDFDNAQAVKVEYVDVASVAASAEGALRRGGLRERVARMATNPQTPAAPADGPEKGAGMDSAKLREALGLSADASDTEVTAALATAGVIPKVSEEEDVDKVTETPTPKPDEVTPTAVPDGLALVPKEELADLKVAASQGVEARQEQLKDKRERLVAAAIGDGRISPARKDAWLKKLEVDPGEEQVLASLEKGVVPVTAPLGTPGGEAKTEDDQTYDALFGAQKVG